MKISEIFLLNAVIVAAVGIFIVLVMKREKTNAVKIVT
jgi:hypothetical protein